MEKANLYRKLERWSGVKFDHVKVIKNSNVEMKKYGDELYACDIGETKALLFICHLSSDTDPEEVVERYNKWVKEYSKKKYAL
ncbi:hypothetical protein H8S21_21555 [Erwinia persicina]|uniref:hypothetical protein n=1 Tax=Erwinia persicina TaxID=55211 RepID=UPI00165453C4|nr:hypothetical protein [Erwinia persicina]MBC3947913.1 hypothetical protein [Erwinia persicina]